ncbi:mucin-4-like isoform X2 [Tympanuchus pallidicinctus]|uniref:mucin-4-like isoform X2 n=1 Tax=Tympanuchus pallidicinctus TaxID=109042 RepID=UPI0022875947|nr:mucin-4-like isoform X2 [Tympanuchus pallidicinctus]
MGTREWMLSTFMGCCLWILHGLGTTTAVPVTTEGPFAATPSQSEAPTALLLGTVGTRTVSDTVMAESILVSPSVSPSFPSWAEPDSVTETTGYNSSLGAERDAELSTGEVTQAPTEVPQVGTDVATSLDATQKNQSGLAAATAAAIVVTPQPNFTPSTKHNVTGTTAAAPSGRTSIFADVPASTITAGGGLESTTDAMFLPSVTIPTAAGTQALTTTPLHPHVTALPPAAGAEVEGVTLPGDSKGDGRALSSIPSLGASGFLPTPWTKVVSGTVGDTLGWAALESGDVGDAANGVFSTADTSQLPPESVAALETAENPGQSSLLTNQAGPSPANLLGPGDGDKQGAPTVLLSGPGSALSDSEAPAAPGVRGDTATLLPGTDVQSDADVPDAGTSVPLSTGAVNLAKSSQQPAPWLSPTREEQSLLGADPPAPTGTSGAPSTAFPPPGVAAGSLLQTDGTEAVVSPDYGADLGVSLSPFLEESQPWGTATDRPSTSLNSALGATNPSSSAPDGTALFAAGQQAEGNTGAGDTTQAENAGDGSPYVNIQSDTSPAATSIQQGPTDNTPGAVLHTELSPAPAPGEGELEPALSPNSPAAASHDLFGDGGSGPLPIEALGAPGAALPPPAAVDGAVFEANNGAEAAVSPDLGAAPGEPASSSLDVLQPWDTAAGAPEDSALPGAEGPDTGINSALNTPSSASSGPVGPPSPSFGIQPGTGLGMPGVDGPDTSLSSALGATNPSSSAPDGTTLPAAGQQAEGNTGAGDTTQAENAGDGSPYVNIQSDTSPAATSIQQGPTDNTPGAVLHTELSPAPAPGEEALAPALSPGGPSAPGHDLSGAGGSGPLPIEALGAPGAALPPPAAVDGAVFEANNGAEAAVSPDLGAAPGEPASSSLDVLQPWDTAAGAPEDSALPGAEGPDTGINSALNTPSSASSGPVGPPSPDIGAQPGTGLTAPGAEGQVLGGVSSAAIFEPSLSSSPGTGLKAGTELLPAALSPSSPASPSDVLTAPSASDTAGPSVLGGAGGAPSALQPSLVAAPGLHSAAGGVRDGAEAVSADGEAPGQSQDQTGTGAAVASDGRQGSTLISISSSPSAHGSSLPEAAAGADTGADIPRAGGAGSSSGFGATALQSNKEIPILPPTTQSNAHVGPPDAKLSQVNVVELAGGKLEASAQGSPPASGGTGLGTVIQIASGVSSPSIPTSPQETQPLVPLAPAASSPLMVAASASARGVGDSSIPNAGPASASSTQSGSSLPAVPQPPVDETASGMLAPLGEELQHAPNAAPALPSASERENLKEGAATSPQLSSLISAIPAVPFYRYGARENDHEYVQRRVDFNSPLFKPEIGFPFGKTLRDSLYFTDNGQIIFPASDSSIFTLPNPPARGFTGHESVPMIAVFWDNADFSRGTGTTFYQEFLTLNSEKPPFIRDVEAKVRHYLRSSYSAAWTLKITWEKAPAYGARGDSRRTNTYQAVLTTDGFRSYVLILYKDGGMQWDYTQLPATNVLIGYTSGDGHYRNDDLTQGSPAAKYRPDRYRGYNTDLRGLWLYKLESRVGINYRLKCLAWTRQQQEPQEWSQDLPACPCSLQQGQQDRRFRSGHGGWGSARVSMLHSASPNSHGAGVRCLYDGRGQLVEGRQERYWRAYRQASPYRDQELKLYDWCCNQAGSARLCARYNEKRPRIGCDGYRAHSAEDSSEDSDSKEQRDEEEE